MRQIYAHIVRLYNNVDLKPFAAKFGFIGKVRKAAIMHLMIIPVSIDTSINWALSMLSNNYDGTFCEDNK